MTPKELVLGGYVSFSEGDMEGLAKIYREDASIKVNGNHEIHDIVLKVHDFLENFISKLPVIFANFRLEILNVSAEGDRVYLHVRYIADNLDCEFVHMFVVKDELETEFYIFDDSQKMAAALGG